ncbi:MAG: CBS domain-containing protein [Deltaproteobacteria bacterium]|nr:CBS domain-containing protein [Deltaproteobacteria bacterium]
MLVSDAMTKNPMTVSASTSIGEVARLMLDEGVRHLPVMEGGGMVGIISDRDIKSVSMPRLVDHEAIDVLRARYDQPISELMAGDPLTAYPETNLAEAVDRMIDNRVGALPIVNADTGDLLGILSQSDVLRVARDRLED